MIAAWHIISCSTAQIPSSPRRTAAGLSALTTRHFRGGDEELLDFNVRKNHLEDSLRLAYVSQQTGDTIIVLLGDHGFKTGELGGWVKHTLMRDNTPVPLLLRDDRFSPRTVRAPVELSDLFSTLVWRDPSLHSPEGKLARAAHEH